jgi:molybdopterin molybdotransferase
VMVTFYQFVREALLAMMGVSPVAPVPTFSATCSARLKKAPGRTEFQRGVLSRGPDGAWTVRPTGEQGAGILKSMSEANCFIVLGDAVGNVEPGTSVEVQLLEGLV